MALSTPRASRRRPTTDGPEGADRPARFLLDPLILVCAALLVAFPFAATVAASGQPTSAPSGTQAPVAAGSAGPRVRDVPAFTPGRAVAAAVERGDVLVDARAMRVAVAAAMQELFDGPGREAVEALVANGRAAASDSEPPYPFRFARLDDALDSALPAKLDDRRVTAANDLGALLVLAAAVHGDDAAFGGAAPLAYAILDRARAGGACLPQLNLAFLLSTHERPRVEATAAELRKAERSCPDDPTPLWLLGQFESQLGDPESADGASWYRRALAASALLQRRFPGSSAGWAGEADAHLRFAYAISDEPFSGRSQFRGALALYRRAQLIDPDRELAAGEARALAGLRLYAAAARLQRGAIAAAPGPAPLEARLVEYLERGGRFGEAAAAAERLAASPRFPRGPGLFMHGTWNRQPDPEDSQQPLSLGSGRLFPVMLNVAPVTGLSLGGAGVVDLSFIPEYRRVDAVTGYDRWCPEWARRRDLVLAGRPGAALVGWPGGFADIRPEEDGADCPATSNQSGGPVLAALAELEAEGEDAAVKRLRMSAFDTGGRRHLVVLLDAQQNLWRFAGNLERARRAVRRWTAVDPAGSLAFDRAGEVAFLTKDYGLAARLFGVSARIARSRARTWSSGEAMALLKRGTALELAGHYTEALAELGESDEVASRAYAGVRTSDTTVGALAAYVSYNARLQSGDTYLRMRRYADALEQYHAARERERDLSQIEPGSQLRRPEVLDNNEALVRIKLGQPAAAVRAARRALRSDPRNPVFLQNLGFALQRLDLRDQSAAAYQAAVRSDPTTFPAWNDLGVVRATQGRLDDATDAFRRAVGVEPGYALGWFNLGVALERSGLRHVVASEGAFARAFRVDPGLRGRERTFIADDDAYFTTLDLSKPLPPKWEFARSQERTPVAVAGLALALLLGLQFGRAALAPGLGGDARRYLDPIRESLARLPRALTSTSAVLAAAATLVVFLLPLARSADATLASALLLGAGVLALIAIVVRSRQLVAHRAGVTLRQRGWPPGIALGLIAAAFGLGWAPLPVAETDRPAPAVHWIGPIVAGIAALVLLPLGVGLEVPTTKALGTAALVMAASLLTPVEPIDGGFVAKGPGGLAATLALLGAAVFVLLQLA